MTTFSRSQGTIHINRFSLNLQKKSPSVSTPELGLHVVINGDEGDVVGADEEVHFGLDHGPDGTGTGTRWGPPHDGGMARVGVGVVGSVFLNGSDGDASGEGEGGGGGGGGVVVAPRAAPLLAPARRR